MNTRSLIQHPAPSNHRGSGTNNSHVRVPVVGALVALVWLTVAVLPATRPNQGGSTYLGAALVAVVAGAAIVMVTSALRQRAMAAGATLTEALAPVLCLAIGSVVLGGLAYAMAGPAPVLQDAFTWSAELGGLATLVSLVPLPASDGARALRIYLARRRTDEQVDAALARSVKAAGIAVIVVGFVVGGLIDLGLGILAVGLGWITLASARLANAKRDLDASLARLRAADVTQLAEPIAGWRTLTDVLREGGGWPLGVSAVPVVDWSGAPAGVISTAAAERALAVGKGDERVSTLAVPTELVPTVDVDAPAATLVTLLAGTAANIAVVTRDGMPVGTVSATDLRNVARTARLRAGANS